MNWPKNIHNNFFLAIAILLTLTVISCTDEILINDPQATYDPTFSVSKHSPNSFIAFRIYPESDNLTRATFDSDYDGKDIFNKGLEFERALYLPTKPETEEEKTEDLVGDEDKSDDEKYKEEDIITPVYHFVILFDEFGNLATEEIIPLSWDKKSETVDYYTLYAKLYDPAVEAIPFEREFKGYVMTVLNASYHLEKEIRKSVKTFYKKQQEDEKFKSDNIRNYDHSYYQMRSFIPKLINETSSDYYLYLQDKEGEYIKDKNGNPYLTMTSSMIRTNFISGRDNNNYIISPAFDGGQKDNEEDIPAFTYYSSKEAAESHPTSLYVERLISKFTVLFQATTNGKMIVGKDNDLKEVNTGKYYLTSNSLPVTVSGDYFPTNRLFLLPKDGSKKIKYVTGYKRSETIDKRRDVPVVETSNWKFNVVGWNINARESKSYLFKNMSPVVNKYYDGWINDSFPYRTFWAEDPNYDKDGFDYPDQFTPSTNDTQTVKPYTQGMALNYYNFKELSGKQIRMYSAENTFNTDILEDNKKSRRELRVGSHLIVTGQLLIGGEEGSEFELPNVYSPLTQTFDKDGLVFYTYNNVKTKYYMNDIYWDEPSYMNYVAEYLGYWLLTPENKAKFGNNDGIFYVNRYGAKADGSYFTTEIVNLKGGDNMIWIKPAKGVKLYTFDPDWEEEDETEVIEEENGSQNSNDTSDESGGEDDDEDDDLNYKGPYRRITDEEFKKLAFEHKNYFAQVFTDGKMYYSAGCEHNLNSASDSSKYNVGDYGTVRNHWYNFIIDGITTPGTAVYAPENKIIPNNEPEVNGMGVSIRVLDWHQEFISTDVTPQRPNNNVNGDKTD